MSNALYLKKIYEHARACPVHDISHTYGEILPESVDVLLSRIQVTDCDHFVDLGSGLGKVVAQVFLQSSVKAATGIELIPALHEQAMQKMRLIQQDWPHLFHNDRSLHFLQGSFFDIPFDFATILLIGSPCFSLTMLSRLGQLIAQHPRIHTVLSLRPIPKCKCLLFEKTVRIEGSWDSALCYIYKRAEETH